ncbi:hypothetical protein DB346_12055 [Verrucomicrobia bacterium LW23]|nr:hypothetical protein DB346_12055 [Verrucomicrobia bacterium LW23]
MRSLFPTISGLWQNQHKSLPYRKSRKSTDQSRTHRSAFSLVEIVIALGIVAFTFSTLLALLPVGLKTFKDAADTAIEAGIVQRTVNDLQQSSFTLFDDPAYIKSFYCDDQGQITEDPSLAIYTITVSRYRDTSLPVGSGVEPLSSTLATLRIAIVNRTRSTATNLYSAVVAVR